MGGDDDVGGVYCSTTLSVMRSLRKKSFRNNLSAPVLKITVLNRLIQNAKSGQEGL